VCTNGMVVSDGTFQRISIKHSGFNPDSVIEASFKVLSAVPDIMNKVQLFQDRILTDAEQLALATGAAAYRWEDLTKAPVSPCMLLNPRRYGDGAKDLWTTLNCVQENIIRGGQRDRSRRRPGRRSFQLISRRISGNKEPPDLPLTQPGSHSRFLDGRLYLLEDRWQFLQPGHALTTIF
jgi:Domain of unknown function (DUF932)